MMIGHFHFWRGVKEAHLQINGGCITFCEDSTPAPCAGYNESQTTRQVSPSIELRLAEACERFAIEVTQILEVSE